MERQQGKTETAAADLKTRKVRFDVTLELELPNDVLFEQGDLIEIEGEELEVREVIRGGAYSANPWHELVVVLKRRGRFAELRARVRQTRSIGDATAAKELT
jgi:hypothetical protein